MLKNKTIAFLGAGSMAEAMISGIVAARKIPLNQITVTNHQKKERLQQLKKRYGIQGVIRENLNLSDIDIIILAMKPKDVKTVLLSIQNSLHPHQIILSVVAGIQTTQIEKHLPQGQEVIRAMPNISSMIRESSTAISPGKYASTESMEIANELLQCIGKVYPITEDKMDIFTGIAGSSPAYFCYLIEHMEKTAIEHGLDKETVRSIIFQTFLGTAKMLLHNNQEPSELRKNITSPNGTTEAGLTALEQHGGGSAISEAVIHAAKRSKEICSDSKELVR